MNKQTMIICLVAIIVTTAIAIYFAKKGHAVSIGLPFFQAKIN